MNFITGGQTVKIEKTDQLSAVLHRGDQMCNIVIKITKLCNEFPTRKTKVVF